MDKNFFNFYFSPLYFWNESYDWIVKSTMTSTLNVVLSDKIAIHWHPIGYCCNQITICSCGTICCKFHSSNLFLQNESESISFGYKNLDFMMTSTIIKNLNRICIFKMNLNTQYEIINIWIYVFFFFDYENKILFYHHIKSGVKSHRLSNLILLNPLKPVSTVVEYGKSRMIHVISQVRKLMLKEIEFGTENNLFWRKTELDLTHRFQNTNEWFQEKRLWLPKYFKQFLCRCPCEPKLGQIFRKILIIGLWNPKALASNFLLEPTIPKFYLRAVQPDPLKLTRFKWDWST